MEYSKFSEIRISTRQKKYLIYWRYEKEKGGLYTRKCQVVQYTTGLRAMPIMYEIIKKIVKLELHSRLEIITETEMPLGEIREELFTSSDIITGIEWKCEVE